ncbi:UvrD-helicase domain-containing protein [Candidatus Hepatobacter penaei]|uniref:UvrD-helicase domain-containing protein n=1 Tax=Candidatus Hepatobacter penaei TaxID=1274402 RepID=UPI0004F292F8|nr:UvrD-helicase domain-containing protein [Candidatus Hepatobacter penaei]
MFLTHEQRAAVNPRISAWVEASAGSGKTRVLTDRLLALMIEGADPERLLCLTFTKAAASEMEARLNSRLSAWSLMPDDEVRDALNDLGLNPTAVRIKRARSLFARVLTLPYGVRIQTLHSFCERLLRRFPLEVGLIPHFRVMDEYAAIKLFRDAFDHVLTQQVSTQGSPQEVSQTTSSKSIQEPTQLRQALMHLSETMNYGQLCDMLWDLLGQRRFATSVGQGGDMAAMKRALGLEQNHKEAYVAAFIERTDQKAYQGLVETLDALDGPQGLSPAVQKTKDLITAMLDHPCEETYAAAAFVFLTKEHQARQRVLPSKIASALVCERLTCEAFVAQETQRFLDFVDKIHAYRVCAESEALVVCFDAVLRRYESEKKAKGVMDYEDLIAKTSALLTVGDAWVAYKIDGGIDHILVDEAQDTSRLQWQVIGGLMDIFFEGSEVHKTLFVVGDPKQSIYSFQGADPRLFHDMRAVLEDKLKRLSRPFRHLRLNTSFRSVPTILSTVDQVFRHPDAHKGVGRVQHQVCDTYKSVRGSVTLWPLLDKNKQEDSEGYTPPQDVRLALTVVMSVQKWLQEGLWLETAQRALRAQDVMILVRKRGPLVDALTRLFKEAGMAVLGQDRFALTQTLVVQDLLALARFCITPDDDLTLATALKGPLIGLTEEELFTACQRPQGDRVWDHLKALSHPWARAAYQKLVAYREKATTATPFAFFTHVLWAQGGARLFFQHGGEDVRDILKEFLTLISAEEPKVGYSLERLLGHIEAQDITIKRDPSTKALGIRILTIHGAKGLEAPLVIIPEASHFQPPAQKLLWCPVGDVYIPVFMRSSLPQTLQAYKAEMNASLDEESRRLFYVALTRAQEHLVMAGTEKARGYEHSWHALMARTLTAKWACDAGTEHKEEVQKEMQQGTQQAHVQTQGRMTFAAARADLEHADEKPSDQDDSAQEGQREEKRRQEEGVSTTQETNQASGKDRAQPRSDKRYAFPPWSSMAHAPLHTPIITPSSRQSSDDANALTTHAWGEKGNAVPSLSRAQAAAYGQAVHGLLAMLPGVPQAAWAQKARDVCAWLALSPDEVSMALREAAAVLTDARFSFLHDPRARREVAFSALDAASSWMPHADRGHRDKGALVSPPTSVPLLSSDSSQAAQVMISARLDFYVAQPHEVRVIDFKTDRRPPQHMPAAYAQQLGMYAALLRPLYTQPIRAYVLWTRTRHLMQALPDEKGQQSV